MSDACGSAVKAEPGVIHSMSFLYQVLNDEHAQQGNSSEFNQPGKPDKEIKVVRPKYHTFSISAHNVGVWTTTRCCYQDAARVILIGCKSGILYFVHMDHDVAYAEVLSMVDFR